MHGRPSGATKSLRLFESLGKWHLAIEEFADGAFSHIAEHEALEKAPLELLTEDKAQAGRGADPA